MMRYTLTLSPPLPCVGGRRPREGGAEPSRRRLRERGPPDEPGVHVDTTPWCSGEPLTGCGRHAVLVGARTHRNEAVWRTETTKRVRVLSWSARPAVPDP